MTLIIDQLKRDLNDTDKAIDDDTASLRLAMTESEFNGTIKLSREIKEIKIKKFNRDKKDSTEGYVYVWRDPDPETPRQRRPRDDYQSSSDQL